MPETPEATVTTEMTVRQDRSEFIVAATAQASTVTDPDSEDHGRRIIHSQRGSFGAVWDLECVVAEIENAREVRWNTDSFIAVVFEDHHLEVHDRDGGRIIFAVRAPAAASHS